MKRIITLLLTVLMITAMFLQVNVYAAGDNGLQDAVKIAKSMFTIPAGFTEFTYSNGTNGDRKVWTLDWSTKEGDERINVGVDEKGNIINYYYQKPYTTQNKKKLPKLSKQDAKIKAEDIIKKINPQLPAQIKYLEDNQNTAAENTYNFSFIRMVDGIQFPENYISVGVNADTGEIQSYSYNWTDGLSFPGKEKVISLDKAESAFKEKLGLKLSYGCSNADNKIKTFAQYSPAFNNAYVDALTGEKVTINYNFYGPMAGYTDNIMVNSSAKMDIGRGNADEVPLTPDEIKAIDEASKLISQEDMEKKLRSIKVLGLSDDFTVANASLGKDWNDNQSLLWQFNFMKSNKAGKGFSPEPINVSADAKTGEIKDFSIYQDSKEGDTVKFDKQASKTAVEQFLKEIQPDKFKETEYDENIEQQRLLTDPNSEEKPREYSFSYVRKVNGIEFPSNSLYARYDAVNGRIIGYTMTWFNTTFEPVDKVVPVDKIYDTLFKEIGLELQYKSDYPSIYYLKMGMPSDKKQDIKLVYSLKPEKPALFDANTGTIITSDGKPFKEVKPVEYKDIKGHYAEKQIKVLAEYGISFEGNEFNPDKNILQKDYVRILCGILNYYYEPRTVDSGNSSQIDEMYKILIREGIIKTSEKAPDSVVTREDSVKFLVRALKYDKVADIKGIFNCTYKDKDKINPALRGYVVIADGLNIIKGYNGIFNPKKTLTRAEAMIEAYNYLQI